MAPHDARPIHRLDPRRALFRLALSLAAGGAVAALLVAVQRSLALTAVAAWDAGGLALVLLSWGTIVRANAIRTRVRAASEDPGRTMVYAIVILTSLSSLFAAIVLARRARLVAPGGEDFVVALSLAAVVLSWALTHTAFTLRYAHLYYREDEEGIGGIDFAGGAKPTYFDFAYFAFTVGMCFQVSDTAVTSPQVRRAVLLHATLSFVYNTAIVAFVLNLVFGMAG
jgi:uncharacterized membrane protein